MKRVHIGCSGWNYADWRGVIYPKGLPARRWLERYAELFDTVEINNTFYRLPSRDAVRGWVEQSPAGFTFAVKSSRYLTHIKRLTDMEQGVRRLLERLEPLTASPKMGPMLWQLPGNYKRDDERLAYALDHLPWLQAQLDVIRPRLLVPVGRHALKRFAPDAQIGEVHGRVLQRDGRALFPMYHPAAALHNQRLLPTLFADARALREVLGAR